MKKYKPPTLIKYGSLEQLTELSTAEAQQLNRLINGIGSLGLFASMEGL